MANNDRSARQYLHDLARKAMRERGLEPDFPPAAVRQAEKLQGPAVAAGPGVRDLRALNWCSIDNDDSRDLDQLSVAEKLEDGGIRVMVAIADVDALVTRGSALDDHARTNTTSVYTSGGIFPMLPERLSTDLTSLNDQQDRLAVVISYVVEADGDVREPQIYPATVRNKAKLAYSSVGSWLYGQGSMPEALAKVAGLPDLLKLQNEAAQRLHAKRHEHGALTLQTLEPEAVVEDGRVTDLRLAQKNEAHELIEDFMVAANGVTARYLTEKGFPTFRRVVREPERWDRLRELVAQYGDTLPPEPDPRPLEAFLERRRTADPVRFPDLSLLIVKLLGPGEYVVNQPGKEPIGHFGLAVRDYSHSTAPNRRYPDVITQRLIKAALDGRPVPYANSDLWTLADHCTKQEDGAKKVERQMRKSAAALFLSDRVGQEFDAVVTGAGPKGTWVRVLQPPVEGKLVRDVKGLDVGDRLRVKLVDTDVERGFIDFIRTTH